MNSGINDPPAQPSGRLAALQYRDFRIFWSGQLVSNVGTWMQMTATSWLLYQLTGSPVLLGLNGIFRAIPAGVRQLPHLLLFQPFCLQSDNPGEKSKNSPV